MKSSYHISLSIVSGICVLALTVSCFKPRRRADRYLIPEGYIGWVRIDYEIKSASSLPIENEFYLLKIPPTGRLQTSTTMEEGFAKDEYYYYSDGSRRPLYETGWGNGGMIWGGFNGRVKGEEGRYGYFFIGTEKQLRTFGWNDKDEHGHPRVGPIELTR